MAIIVIKDLPDSVELDREAMQAIAGGARSRGRQALPRRMSFRGNPPGAPLAFGYRASLAARNRTAPPFGRPPR